MLVGDARHVHAGQCLVHRERGEGYDTHEPYESVRERMLPHVHRCAGHRANWGGSYSKLSRFHSGAGDQR